MGEHSGGGRSEQIPNYLPLLRCWNVLTMPTMERSMSASTPRFPCSNFGQISISRFFGNLRIPFQRNGPKKVFGYGRQHRQESQSCTSAKKLERFPMI